MSVRQAWRLVLVVAALLLNAASICGYESIGAVALESACCPCSVQNAGRVVSMGCCACAETTPQRKIPLRPVQNEGDKDVQSCSLIPGDALQSRAACLTAGSGKVHCFYVNAATQTVTQKTFLKGVPQESVDLGGTVRDEIAGVGTRSGKITLVALTLQNELQTNYFNRRDWSGWESIGGIAMELPAIMTHVSSGVTFFYRSIDNELSYVDRSRYGAWSEHEKLNTEGMQSPPICVARGEDEVEECFAAGSHNSLTHEQWQFGSGWMILDAQEGVIKGRPCLTSLDYDNVDLFALGPKNQLMHKRYQEETWSEWTDLGGTLASGPECLTVGKSHIHCFALGPRHALLHIFFDGVEWSKWSSASYALTDRPSCVLSTENTISCYTRGFTDELVEVVYAL